jgi:hypothetical protein
LEPNNRYKAIEPEEPFRTIHRICHRPDIGTEDAGFIKADGRAHPPTRHGTCGYQHGTTHGTPSL